MTDAQAEERWRKRTFAFSIASAVLTAAVTIGAAFLTHLWPTAVDITSVVNCQNDLTRLIDETTRQRNATAEQLSDAIGADTKSCLALLSTLEAQNGGPH